MNDTELFPTRGSFWVANARPVVYAVVQEGTRSEHGKFVMVPAQHPAEMVVS